MIALGLNEDDRAAYLAALRTSHRIKVRVTVRNKDEEELASITPVVLSGAVQVDATAEVTRSLSMVFLDPKHRMTFDAASPSAKALYADNFVSVEYGVHVSAIRRWVWVPVFWGPVTAFERQGAEVTIEAQGKESLGLEPHLVVNGYTIPHGLATANAVRSVMRRIGETRFRGMGGIKGKLRKHRAVAPGEAPWHVVKGGGSDGSGADKPGLVAKSSGHPFLFYDGEGYLTSKKRGGSSCYTFNGHNVLSQPGFKYDVLEVINRVEVLGGTPRGKPHGPHHRGHAELPASHPLSPTSLARNGKKRYMVTFFDSDSLKSDAACRRKAADILRQHTTEGLEASFDALPVPHLEEYDTVTLALDGYTLTFPLTTFTMPLTADSPMTIGGMKAISLSSKKHNKAH